MADSAAQPVPNIIADFDVPTLVGDISRQGVIVFGAGMIGKATLITLQQLNIANISLVDNDEKKHNTHLQGLTVLPPEQLVLLSPTTPVLVASVYIVPIIKQLHALGFVNFYACSPFIDQANEHPSLPTPLSHADQRSLDLYSFTIKAITDLAGIYIKSLDVVLTERCTLKCHDCANLMQYYAKPKNCIHSTILQSVDRFLSAIDQLFEFRLLGGEPFVDKTMHEVLNRLIQYEKVSYIIIYTNGTIIPNSDILESLKNMKVQVQVTDYGLLSRHFNQLLTIFDQHAINYTVVKFEKWQDCGGIEIRTRTEKELERLYANCCAADTYTLLHGTLFPCPFSAHAVNLEAIPSQRSEQVVLDDEMISVNSLREQIQLFTQSRLHLQACLYCGGRDFGQATIPAAVQSSNPRPYNKHGDNHAR